MQAVAKGIELGLIDEKMVRVISEAGEPEGHHGPLSKAMIRMRIRQAIREQYRQLTGKVS
jgi:hypothetical protein